MDVAVILDLSDSSVLWPMAWMDCIIAAAYIFAIDNLSVVFAPVAAFGVQIAMDNLQATDANALGSDKVPHLAMIRTDRHKADAEGQLQEGLPAYCFDDRISPWSDHPFVTLHRLPFLLVLLLILFLLQPRQLAISHTPSIRLVLSHSRGSLSLHALGTCRDHLVHQLRYRPRGAPSWPGVENLIWTQTFLQCLHNSVGH
mmetsp:Transcript_11767/g.29003  ORF Transcript_11767/g.29003 Transcript_11767/m.29003 type:complete len:200 (-) Transcript_11767:76-675(-)